MTADQQAWMDRAERALDAARVLLDHDSVEACLNRAYYAAFYAARAALSGVGEQPKTHAATQSCFAFHFVRTGQLPASVGRLLVDAFESRLRADYDALTVHDTRAAADALADAEAFVVAIRSLLAPTP